MPIACEVFSRGLAQDYTMQSLPKMTYPSLTQEHMNTTRLLDLLAASFSGKHDFISYLIASFVQVGEKSQNSLQKQFTRLIPASVYKTDRFRMQGILDAPKPPKCQWFAKHFICMKKMNSSSSVTA